MGREVRGVITRGFDDLLGFGSLVPQETGNDHVHRMNEKYAPLSTGKERKKERGYKKNSGREGNVEKNQKIPYNRPL